MYFLPGPQHLLRYGAPAGASSEESKQSSSETSSRVEFSYEQLQRALQNLQLGFSPRDLADLVRLADPENSGSVTLEVCLV